MKEQRTNAPTGQLKKSLTAFDFFTIGFGAIVGVAWAISLGDWLNLGGGPISVIIAFVVGTLVILPVALIYGRLAARFPNAGGAMLYANEAFGRKAGFLTGWFILLSYAMLCPFEAIAIGQLAETLIPALKAFPLYDVGGYTIYAPTLLLELVVAGAIVWGNLRGIDTVAKLQKVLVFGILGVTLIAIVVALLFGQGGDAFASAPTADNPRGSILVGALAVIAMTPFYFSGFDTIPQEVEEKKDAVSPKQIGGTIVAAVLGAGAFYVLIVAGLCYAMPWQEMLKHSLPASAAFEVGLGMPLVGRIMVIGALCGLISTLNSFYIAGARVLLAMGREEMLPAAFAKTHSRYQTPYVANMAIAAVTVVGVFGGRTLLLPIVNIGSLGFMLAWMMSVCAGYRLERGDGGMKPTSKALYLIAIVFSAAMVLLIVVPGSPGMLSWPWEWCLFLCWLLLGIVILRHIDRRKKQG